MTNIRVWAIIGDSRTGKSTTIGELISQRGTGAGGVREIFLRGNGYLYVYARRQAWQENNKSPEDAARIVQRQIAAMQRRTPHMQVNWFNVLMALRCDPVKGQPHGYEYLTYFVQRGWFIESLVLLTPTGRQYNDEYGRFGAPTLYVPDSVELLRGGRSWLVGQVRNHFGWA